MEPYTAILVRGACKSDVKTLSAQIRLPVVGFIAIDEAGLAAGECNSIPKSDRETIREVTYSLYESASWQCQDEIADPVDFSRSEVARMRDLLDSLEAQLNQQSVELDGLIAVANALRAEAEQLSFALFSYDLGRD